MKTATESSDTLKIYIEPQDGMGRFVQIVGRITLHAAVLPQDADAITIGRQTFDPADVRAAYRAPLLGGAYYALELPIAAPPNSAVNECTVSATLNDGISGQQLQTQKVLPLKAH
jgi:hypothetical protein